MTEDQKIIFIYTLALIGVAGLFARVTYCFGVRSGIRHERGRKNEQENK